MKNEQNPTKELVVNGNSGYMMLFVELLAIPALQIILFSLMVGGEQPLLMIPFLMIGLFWFFALFGFLIINPNESAVLTLFGTYKGTLRENGFYWMNPFLSKNKISLRARNMDGKVLKVNDKLGNPIEIAAVLVWKVEDTAKAAFAVEDYTQYVTTQSEAAVRHLAVTHPYDYFGEEDATNKEISLKDGGDVINELLEQELRERLSLSGIVVIEARISHLAYAAEIASVMLQRQQAIAVVAARSKIVEGAVGMVELALDKLEKKGTIHLDEERKAAMVSNLMVVLCSDRSVSPVVNTGSLH